MKKLMRRFRRVADAPSQQYYYYELKEEESKRREVPEGYVPVSVGEREERFVVSAEMLNHPIFVELLKRSAQEYGYEQQGVLRIPCPVPPFRRLLHLISMRLPPPPHLLSSLLPFLH